jgi:ABC-type bacteriocin/lantibiotic exporter with double-glycine peptidase domain
MTKYSFIKQASEEDCGAACLAMIAKFYGKNHTITKLRELVGTGKKGTTLLGLRRGSEVLGFNTRSAQATPEVKSQIIDNINDLNLPAIINWRGYHYVVLYGQKNKQYVIADPGIGIRYISKEELLENWYEGIILLLEPDASRFTEQKADKIQGFGRFFKRILPYKGVLFLALIINLILGLLSLASPFFIQILTDDVLVRGDTQILKGLAIAIIIMTIVSSSLSFVQAQKC